MQKLLTIIIPTYNMQDYLKRCLDSLIVPSDQMDQLEVLVINDGSKDNSSHIAHSYQDRFPETFRVIDKENGNYGSCVNRGLKEASAKYVRILDADDWYDTVDFLGYLNRLKSVDVDMVITDFEQVDNEGKCVKKFSYKIPYDVPLSFLDIQDAEYYGLHAITYDIRVLREMNYHQTEGISYTDTEWVYFPQTHVQKIVYLPYNVYRYYLGREGQTMDPKVLLKSVNHYTKLIKSMIEFSDNLQAEFKKNSGAQRLEAQIQHLLEGVYKTCLIKQNKRIFEASLLSEFDEFLRRRRPQVYREIGKLRLMFHFPFHYVRFWRLFGVRFPVDFIRDSYRVIRYGKN